MLLVRGMDAFELDDVAEFIWGLCDGTHTAEDIASAVAKEFDVTPERALKDVDAFLKDLLSARLLEN